MVWSPTTEAFWSPGREKAWFPASEGPWPPTDVLNVLLESDIINDILSSVVCL